MSYKENFKPINYSTGKVRCRINLRPLDIKLDEAQEWFANAVLEDVVAIMPEDTGAMIASTGVRYHGKDIITRVPYAMFQYYGNVMVDPQTGSPWARAGATKVVTAKPLNYKKAGATSHWFEVAAERHKDEWLAGVSDIINKE